jgi:hypothetical protein
MGVPHVDKSVGIIKPFSLRIVSGRGVSNAPFPNDSRNISCIFKRFGDGKFIISNELMR